LLADSSLVPKPKASRKPEKRRGRPKLDKETFSVRLSAQTKARLNRALEQTKRGFSDYIELALIDRLNKDKIK